MAIADFQTLEKKKVELYSDFLINFDMNPITGSLAKVTNEESVKQSLKNLILIAIGERFYYFYKGSRIRTSLFEIVDPTNLEMIRVQINEACVAYEPRAKILDVVLREGLDKNSYDITVVFSIINIPDRNFELTVVKRIR
jgi:phage baseplate assembly protein W